MIEQTVRVLVVDDDPDILAFMRVALELEGYSVQTAQNGLDALACVQRNAAAFPMVVVTDLYMPAMNGWDFVRAFREGWGDAVPIIVMSATVSSIPAGRALKAAAVLTKPFGLEALLAAVDRQLAPVR
jgi:DNA-binding response OmpR family regulator